MNQALSYAAVAFIADERKRAIETLKAERDELVAALVQIQHRAESGFTVSDLQEIARAALANLKSLDKL